MDFICSIFHLNSAAYSPELVANIFNMQLTKI